MSELKTLDEIEYPLGNDNISEDKEAVNRYALKHEAIKQVQNVLDLPVDTMENKQNAVRLMMHFFNITE